MRAHTEPCSYIKSVSCRRGASHANCCRAVRRGTPLHARRNSSTIKSRGNFSREASANMHHWVLLFRKGRLRSPLIRKLLGGERSKARLRRCSCHRARLHPRMSKRHPALPRVQGPTRPPGLHTGTRPCAGSRADALGGPTRVWPGHAAPPRRGRRRRSAERARGAAAVPHEAGVLRALAGLGPVAAQLLHSSAWLNPPQAMHGTSQTRGRQPCTSLLRAFTCLGPVLAQLLHSSAFIDALRIDQCTAGKDAPIA